MASRPIHNKIARKLTGYSIDLIDDTNKRQDEPVKWMGKSHRQVRHSSNPFRLDSLIVTGGDPRREVVRQIHRIVDTSPIGQMAAKILELQDNVRKMKK